LATPFSFYTPEGRILYDYQLKFHLQKPTAFDFSPKFES